MGVTLKQLAVFAAIADHEGFGAAAEALGMGQSSVSHALAAMEREVDGELVHRTVPVRPTPLGELLLPHARASLASARALSAAASAFHSPDAAATIGFAVPPTAAQGLLPNLLKLWRTHLPHAQIKIFEGLDEEIETWLEGGTVDAALLTDPDPMPRGALRVATDTYQAVVRTDHPLAGQDAISLDDLLDDPLLATTSGCETAVKQLHALVGRPYRPTQRIREFTTLLAMVEAGLGVAIVPSLAAGMLSDTLTLVPLLPRLERHLVLTGPAGRPWHPSVTAIRDLSRSQGPHTG
ncbi:LysR family transcriptional regulator [Streptomyces siamensis]|uniref:LysR substrate-binding domain-containing protein n=1 Tax=Streptomyces siamensis TaxID=1274986 RepID=A0ABP9J163_9ACTN